MKTDQTITDLQRLPANDTSRLENIRNNLAVKFAHASAIDEQPDTDPIPVALSNPWNGTPFVINVASQNLAALLNEAGQQTKAAGLCDVKVRLQDSNATGNELTVQHSGIIVDIDRSYPDLLQVFEAAGLPQPNVIYQTTHGHRAVFVFEKPINSQVFEMVGKKFVVNIKGSDSASWLSTQDQHLPTCIETVRGQGVVVDFPAIQVHSNRLKTEEFLSELTPAFRKTIAPSGPLSSADRKVVEDHLASLGIAAPGEPGQLTYPRCPEGPHSNCSCTITRKVGGDNFCHLHWCT